MFSFSSQGSLPDLDRLHPGCLVLIVVLRLGYPRCHVFHLVVDLVVAARRDLAAELALLEEVVDDLHGLLGVVIEEHVDSVVGDVAERAAEELEEELLVAVVLSHHVLGQTEIEVEGVRSQGELLVHGGEEVLQRALLLEEEFLRIKGGAGVVDSVLLLPHAVVVARQVTTRVHHPTGAEIRIAVGVKAVAWTATTELVRSFEVPTA